MSAEDLQREITMLEAEVYELERSIQQQSMRHSTPITRIHGASGPRPVSVDSGIVTMRRPAVPDADNTGGQLEGIRRKVSFANSGDDDHLASDVTHRRRPGNIRLSDEMASNVTVRDDVCSSVRAPEEFVERRRDVKPAT